VSQLRVSAGRLKGSRLEVPHGVRPTESRVREALISIWRHRLEGADVLDLFAGSGAVGLEAMSHGARRVVFVEAAPKVLNVLRRNLERWADGECSARRGRLPARVPVAPGETFDLVFADPPYAFDAYPALIRAAVTLLRAGGELAIEHSVRREVPETVPGWSLRDRRRYGETALSLYSATVG